MAAQRRRPKPSLRKLATMVASPILFARTSPRLTAARDSKAKRFLL